MKVTSQDIRNLAEALPILQNHMSFHTTTISILRDCISLAIKDYKNSLLYEDGEESENDD